MFGWPGWGIIFTLSPWNPTSSPRILAQARFMERDNGEAGFTRCVLSDLSLESLKGFCLKWCHPWLLTQFILCGDHACTIDDEFRSALTCPDDNFRKRLMFFLGLIVSVECTVCFWGFHHPDRHEFHRSIVFANLHGRSRKLRATKYRLICGFLWFSTKYIWRGENPGQWTNQLGDCFAAVGSTQTGRVPVGDELCRCFRWRMRDELLDIWIHPMQSHKHCMLFIYWDSVCIWNVCFPVSHVYISILGFKQDIRTHQLKAWLDTLVIFEVWLGTVLRCREWTLWVGSVALMEEAQTQTRPEGVEDWFQVLPNLFLGHVKERNCEFMNFTQSTCFCVQDDMHRTYFILKILFKKDIFIYNLCISYLH